MLKDKVGSMAKKAMQCPNCGSTEIVPIVYGYPTKKTWQDQSEGKVVLGGCCVSSANPDVHCKACGHEWKKPMPWLSKVQIEKF
jgi:ribosomal protein S27E